MNLQTVTTWQCDRCDRQGVSKTILPPDGWRRMSIDMQPVDHCDACISEVKIEVSDVNRIARDGSVDIVQLIGSVIK